MASESGSVHSYATAKFEPLLSPTTQCEFFKEQMKEANIDTQQISESQSWSTQDIHHPDIEIGKTSYENVPIQFHPVEFNSLGTPMFDDRPIQAPTLMNPNPARSQRSTSAPCPNFIHKPIPTKHRPSPLQHQQPNQRRKSAVSQGSLLEPPPVIERPSSATSNFHMAWDSNQIPVDLMSEFNSTIGVHGVPMIRVNSMPHLNQDMNTINTGPNMMSMQMQMGNMNFNGIPFDGMVKKLYLCQYYTD
jgi:hypothetical protein